jgi:hypothetical protein
MWMPKTIVGNARLTLIPRDVSRENVTHEQRKGYLEKSKSNAIFDTYQLTNYTITRIRCAQKNTK